MEVTKQKLTKLLSRQSQLSGDIPPLPNVSTSVDKRTVDREAERIKQRQKASEQERERIRETQYEIASPDDPEATRRRVTNRLPFGLQNQCLGINESKNKYPYDSDDPVRTPLRARRVRSILPSPDDIDLQRVGFIKSPIPTRKARSVSPASTRSRILNMPLGSNEAPPSLQARFCNADAVEARRRARLESLATSGATISSRTGGMTTSTSLFTNDSADIGHGGSVGNNMSFDVLHTMRVTKSVSKWQRTLMDCHDLSAVMSHTPKLSPLVQQLGVDELQFWVNGSLSSSRGLESGGQVSTDDFRLFAQPERVVKYDDLRGLALFSGEPLQLTPSDSLFDRVCTIFGLFTTRCGRLSSSTAPRDTVVHVHWHWQSDSTSSHSLDQCISSVLVAVSCPSVDAPFSTLPGGSGEALRDLFGLTICSLLSQVNAALSERVTQLTWQARQLSLNHTATEASWKVSSHKALLALSLLLSSIRPTEAPLALQAVARTSAVDADTICWALLISRRVTVCGVSGRYVSVCVSRGGDSVSNGLRGWLNKPEFVGDASVLANLLGNGTQGAATVQQLSDIEHIKWLRSAASQTVGNLTHPGAWDFDIPSGDRFSIVRSIFPVGQLDSADGAVCVLLTELRGVFGSSPSVVEDRLAYASDLTTLAAAAFARLHVESSMTRLSSQRLAAVTVTEAFVPPVPAHGYNTQSIMVSADDPLRALHVAAQEGVGRSLSSVITSLESSRISSLLGVRQCVLLLSGAVGRALGCIERPIESNHSQTQFYLARPGSYSDYVCITVVPNDAEWLSDLRAGRAVLYTSPRLLDSGYGNSYSATGSLNDLMSSVDNEGASTAALLPIHTAAGLAILVLVDRFDTSPLPAIPPLTGNGVGEGIVSFSASSVDELLSSRLLTAVCGSLDSALDRQHLIASATAGLNIQTEDQRSQQVLITNLSARIQRSTIRHAFNEWRAAFRYQRLQSENQKRVFLADSLIRFVNFRETTGFSLKNSSFTDNSLVSEKLTRCYMDVVGDTVRRMFPSDSVVVSLPGEKQSISPLHNTLRLNVTYSIDCTSASRCATCHPCGATCGRRCEILLAEVLICRSAPFSTDDNQEGEEICHLAGVVFTSLVSAVVDHVNCVTAAAAAAAVQHEIDSRRGGDIRRLALPFLDGLVPRLLDSVHATPSERTSAVLQPIADWLQALTASEVALVSMNIKQLVGVENNSGNNMQTATSRGDVVSVVQGDNSLKVLGRSRFVSFDPPFNDQNVDVWSQSGGEGETKVVTCKFRNPSDTSADSNVLGEVRLVMRAGTNLTFEQRAAIEFIGLLLTTTSTLRRELQAAANSLDLALLANQQAKEEVAIAKQEAESADQRLAAVRNESSSIAGERDLAQRLVELCTSLSETPSLTALGERIWHTLPGLVSAESTLLLVNSAFTTVNPDEMDATLVAALGSSDVRQHGSVASRMLSDNFVPLWPAAEIALSRREIVGEGISLTRLLSLPGALSDGLQSPVSAIPLTLPGGRKVFAAILTFRAPGSPISNSVTTGGAVSLAQRRLSETVQRCLSAVIASVIDICETQATTLRLNRRVATVSAELSRAESLCADRLEVLDRLSETQKILSVTISERDSALEAVEATRLEAEKLSATQKKVETALLATHSSAEESLRTAFAVEEAALRERIRAATSECDSLRALLNRNDSTVERLVETSERYAYDIRCESPSTAISWLRDIADSCHAALFCFVDDTRQAEELPPALAAVPGLWAAACQAIRSQQRVSFVANLQHNNTGSNSIAAAALSGNGVLSGPWATTTSSPSALNGASQCELLLVPCRVAVKPGQQINSTSVAAAMGAQCFIFFRLHGPATAVGNAAGFSADDTCSLELAANLVSRSLQRSDAAIAASDLSVCQLRLSRATEEKTVLLRALRTIGEGLLTSPPRTRSELAAAVQSTASIVLKRDGCEVRRVQESVGAGAGAGGLTSSEGFAKSVIEYDSLVVYGSALHRLGTRNDASCMASEKLARLLSSSLSSGSMVISDNLLAIPIHGADGEIRAALIVEKRLSFSGGLLSTVGSMSGSSSPRSANGVKASTPVTDGALLLDELRVSETDSALATLIAQAAAVSFERLAALREASSSLDDASQAITTVQQANANLTQELTLAEADRVQLLGALTSGIDVLAASTARKQSLTAAIETIRTLSRSTLNATAVYLMLPATYSSLDNGDKSSHEHPTFDTNRSLHIGHNVWVGDADGVIKASLDGSDVEVRAMVQRRPVLIGPDEDMVIAADSSGGVAEASLRSWSVRHLVASGRVAVPPTGAIGVYGMAVPLRLLSENAPEIELEGDSLAPSVSAREEAVLIILRENRPLAPHERSLAQWYGALFAFTSAAATRQRYTSSVIASLRQAEALLASESQTVKQLKHQAQRTPEIAADLTRPSAAEATARALGEIHAFAAALRADAVADCSAADADDAFIESEYAANMDISPRRGAVSGLAGAVKKAVGRSARLATGEAAMFASLAEAAFGCNLVHVAEAEIALAADAGPLWRRELSSPLVGRLEVWLRPQDGRLEDSGSSDECLVQEGFLRWETPSTRNISCYSLKWTTSQAASTVEVRLALLRRCADLSWTWLAELRSTAATAAQATQESRAAIVTAGEVQRQCEERLAAMESASKLSASESAILYNNRLDEKNHSLAVQSALSETAIQTVARTLEIPSNGDLHELPSLNASQLWGSVAEAASLSYAEITYAPQFATKEESVKSFVSSIGDTLFGSFAPLSAQWLGLQLAHWYGSSSVDRRPRLLVAAGDHQVVARGELDAILDSHGGITCGGEGRCYAFASLVGHDDLPAGTYIICSPLPMSNSGHPNADPIHVSVHIIMPTSSNQELNVGTVRLVTRGIAQCFLVSSLTTFLRDSLMMNFTTLKQESLSTETALRVDMETITNKSASQHRKDNKIIRALRVRAGMLAVDRILLASDIRHWKLKAVLGRLGAVVGGEKAEELVVTQTNLVESIDLRDKYERRLADWRELASGLTGASAAARVSIQALWAAAASPLVSRLASEVRVVRLSLVPATSGTEKNFSELVVRRLATPIKLPTRQQPMSTTDDKSDEYSDDEECAECDAYAAATLEHTSTDDQMSVVKQLLDWLFTNNYSSLAGVQRMYRFDGGHEVSSPDSEYVTFVVPVRTAQQVLAAIVCTISAPSSSGAVNNDTSNSVKLPSSTTLLNDTPCTPTKTQSENISHGLEAAEANLMAYGELLAPLLVSASSAARQRKAHSTLRARLAESSSRVRQLTSEVASLTASEATLRGILGALGASAEEGLVVQDNIIGKFTQKSAEALARILFCHVELRVRRKHTNKPVDLEDDTEWISASSNGPIANHKNEDGTETSRKRIHSSINGLDGRELGRVFVLVDARMSARLSSIVPAIASLLSGLILTAWRISDSIQQRSEAEKAISTTVDELQDLRTLTDRAARDAADAQSSLEVQRRWAKLASKCVEFLSRRAAVSAMESVSDTATTVGSLSPSEDNNEIFISTVPAWPLANSTTQFLSELLNVARPLAGGESAALAIGLSTAVSNVDAPLEWISSSMASSPMDVSTEPSLSAVGSVTLGNITSALRWEDLNEASRATVAGLAVSVMRSRRRQRIVVSQEGDGGLLSLRLAATPLIDSVNGDVVLGVVLMIQRLPLSISSIPPPRIESPRISNPPLSQPFLSLQPPHSLSNQSVSPVSTAGDTTIDASETSALCDLAALIVRIVSASSAEKIASDARVTAAATVVSASENAAAASGLAEANEHQRTVWRGIAALGAALLRHVSSPSTISAIASLAAASATGAVSPLAVAAEVAELLFPISICQAALAGTPLFIRIRPVIITGDDLRIGGATDGETLARSLVMLPPLSDQDIDSDAPVDYMLPQVASAVASGSPAAIIAYVHANSAEHSNWPSLNVSAGDAVSAVEALIRATWRLAATSSREVIGSASRELRLADAEKLREENDSVNKNAMTMRVSASNALEDLVAHATKTATLADSTVAMLLDGLANDALVATLPPLPTTHTELVQAIDSLIYSTSNRHLHLASHALSGLLSSATLSTPRAHLSLLIRRPTNETDDALRVLMFDTLSGPNGLSLRLPCERDGLYSSSSSNYAPSTPLSQSSVVESAFVSCGGSAIQASAVVLTAADAAGLPQSFLSSVDENANSKFVIFAVGIRYRAHAPTSCNSKRCDAVLRLVLSTSDNTIMTSTSDENVSITADFGLCSLSNSLLRIYCRQFISSFGVAESAALALLCHRAESSATLAAAAQATRSSIAQEISSNMYGNREGNGLSDSARIRHFQRIVMRHAAILLDPPVVSSSGATSNALPIHPAALPPLLASQDTSMKLLRSTRAALASDGQALVLRDTTTHPITYQVISSGGGFAWPGVHSETFGVVTAHNGNGCREPNSLIEEVIRTGRTIVATSAGEDPRFKSSFDGSCDPASPLMITPIRGRSSAVIGVLMVCRAPFETPFSSKDVLAIELLSSNGALALYWCQGLAAIHQQLHRYRSERRSSSSNTDLPAE